MARWAFHSQCFFLAHKLKLHQELAACDRPAVIDRTIYEDAEIFARNLHAQGYLSKRDWSRLPRALRGHLPEPPAAGRAHRPHLPARDPRRSASRGAAARWRRPSPTRTSGASTASTRAGSTRTTLSPIVRIDTGKLDYVEDLVDLIEVTRTLDAALLG